MTYEAPTIDRRTLLRGSLFGALMALAASCSSGSSEGTSRRTADGTAPSSGQQPTRMTSRATGRRVLLAYFSRPGENYYYGDRIDLEVGNTEVLAGLIAKHLDCDVHRIEAAEPYSADYDATVSRNLREQEANARPEIASPLASIDQYDVVLLASPIWNVRPPMITHSLAESYDFTGKTVHPITTHAMSGLRTSEREYGRACRGASIAEGLAVQGEEVAEAEPAVVSWLQHNNLRGGNS